MALAARPCYTRYMGKDIATRLGFVMPVPSHANGFAPSAMWRSLPPEKAPAKRLAKRRRAR
jgi:hypothetical protein